MNVNLAPFLHDNVFGRDKSANTQHISMRSGTMDNVLLFPKNEEIIGRRKGGVRCKERLGGLLKYYHREAA